MTTLTPRQLEILRLSAEGFSGPQIAVRLHVTVATVNEHRTRIRNRLGASTAAHAVAIAYQRGILQGFDGTDVLRQLDSARAWAVEWQQRADMLAWLLAEAAWKRGQPDTGSPIYAYTWDEASMKWSLTEVA